MKTGSHLSKASRTLALVACMLASPALQAAASDDVVRQINAYRTSPGNCGATIMPGAEALRAHPALAAFRISTGTLLPYALQQQGYEAEHVEAMSVSGPTEPTAVLATLKEHYCTTLRDPRFKTVGVSRSGNAWQIVLAQPAPPRPPSPPPLAPVEQIGQAALDAVNRARASARFCGSRHVDPAPPLTLSAALGKASIAHSRDMAYHGYFAHQGRDGSGVGQRARAAGYAWAGIAENIAYGQRSVEEAVASWVASPGHCVNIMNPLYTEMGIAYALDTIARRPYWTQVLGLPR